MLFTDYIWDFDGTLFDTYPRISTSFREALRQLGCERPEAEILSAVKMSVRGAANDYARRYNLDAREINRLYHEIESALPIDDMIDSSSERSSFVYGVISTYSMSPCVRCTGRAHDEARRKA